MNLRKNIKNGFYSVQRRIARRSTRAVGNGRTDRIVVFAMHAINNARSEMAVSPSRFLEQLKSLLDVGYRPLTMDEVLNVLSDRKPSLPGFAITFDDGYESVFTNALPILELLSIPATVFLTTGFLDGAVSPPWRASNSALLTEYRSQAEYFCPLTWGQALTLAQHPLIRLGSHSVSHPLLGALPEESVRDELVRSKFILADRLGTTPDYFAYPFGVRRYGAYSKTTERLVSESGYRCSLTSEISCARVGYGSWGIPRMSLTEEDTGMDAIAKASGAYDWVGAAQTFYQFIFPNPQKV